MFFPRSILIVYLDDFAQRLATTSQEVARKRHYYALVSNNLLSIYQAIITEKLPLDEKK